MSNTDPMRAMLEFAAQLEPSEAKMFFSKWTKVLAQLAMNLEKIESPYAWLIRWLEHSTQLVKVAA